jgi:hypothetical protein
LAVRTSVVREVTRALRGKSISGAIKTALALVYGRGGIYVDETGRKYFPVRKFKGESYEQV